MSHRKKWIVHKFQVSTDKFKFFNLLSILGQEASVTSIKSTRCRWKVKGTPTESPAKVGTSFQSPVTPRVTESRATPVPPSPSAGVRPGGLGRPGVGRVVYPYLSPGEKSRDLRHSSGWLLKTTKCWRLLLVRNHSIVGGSGWVPTQRP